MAALLTTEIPGLPAPRRGKVREVYDLGDELLIVATDRISAFDVIMANGIPDKGKILNQMSAFWFDLLQGLCPNHILSVDDGTIQSRLDDPQPELEGRTTLARKARPLPIECVARGYLSGSLYKEYRAGGGSVHGLSLPDGLVDSSQLPDPIFTPATKAQEGHDENISYRQAADLVGAETARKVRDWTLALYRQAADHASKAGIILADTKFEFGETDEGIVWIDEALTPDSSRFWDASRYQPGKSQPSYDKQFVRDYLETLDWDKRPPGPELPDEIVQKTRAKYVEAFERLTGKAFRG
ncbi:MAG TPA: phosphoribosylaminoimidazolesuccinocarboxamide synthase [Fimbriimonas sp.]